MSIDTITTQNPKSSNFHESFINRVNIKFTDAFASHTITISKSPTHNCQLFIIGGIENILYNIEEKDYNTLLVFLEYLRDSPPYKKIALIDVHNYDVIKNKIPFRSIISINNYISTNKNHRYIILINILKAIQILKARLRAQKKNK